MYALISPEEQARNSQGAVLGQRVAQVSDDTFQVAPPLFWIPCDDAVVADQYYYDPATKTINKIDG